MEERRFRGRPRPRGARRRWHGEAELLDEFTSITNAVGPRAILDLVLVWYLVYRLLLIVRGTRTIPMAAGLLIVFVVYQGARWLGLVTLYTLLHTFVSVIVIFALIVFQDDIRRALVRVGRFARFSRAQEAQVVEEVIRGASSLAKRRIGALIVFEREARLDDFIEAGTSLDASVTRDLLYGIFIPAFENPLHDGAVIVRNFRIYKAGAFLPLARNPKIDKALGTRHRAGIGITEETDAIAVVVSEERGTISLCHEGRISSGLEPAQLRKQLLGYFSAPRKGWRPREEEKETEEAPGEVEDEDLERTVRTTREPSGDKPRSAPRGSRDKGERTGTSRLPSGKTDRPRSPSWPGADRLERPSTGRVVTAKAEE